ncbi:MAG: peroxiredoxin [Deltaproteobacteria bacterium]|jgi:peroxiredoxin|nr:peroxiredoxin [Deltaproteobacteria bacterium]MBW2416581.1 peroxiredoxin [Deltaproteobacteria bacterium]
MAIQVGDRFPEAKVQIATENGIENSTTADLLGGKKVVLFAVPGAFTPTCSAKHLPGFIDRADEITGKGVDSILCLSVNDAFVMDAWAKDRGAGSKVTMVADGSGEITRALGLEMDGSSFGMGMRCQRFAAVIDDGTVTVLQVEAPMKFEVSSAEAILAAL